MIETRPLNAATLLIVVGGTADREVALGVQRAILQGVQAGRTSAIVDLSARLTASWLWLRRG